MTEYEALVRTADGSREWITVAAGSEEAALRAAEQRGHIVARVRPRRGDTGTLSASARASFFAMLSVLMRSGLTITGALRVLVTSGESQQVRNVAERVHRRVDEGGTFADAVEPYIGFEPVVIGMLRVGQQIGALGRVLPMLTEYLNERKALRDKVLSALAYPLFVLIVAILGAVVIGLTVVPQLSGVFESIGRSAPEAATRIERGIVALRLFGIGFGLLCVVGPLVLAVIRRLSPRTRLATDRLVLRLPFARRPLLDFDLSRATFALAVLTESGVNLQEALRLAGLVCRNQAVQQALEVAREASRNGAALSVALSGSGILPRSLIAWVQVGEETGEVAGVFTQLRTYYRSRVERLTERFVALVEPALIVLVGAAVLAIAVTFVVPLFTSFSGLL